MFRLLGAVRGLMNMDPGSEVNDSWMVLQSLFGGKLLEALLPVSHRQDRTSDETTLPETAPVTLTGRYRSCSPEQSPPLI